MNFEKYLSQAFYSGESISIPRLGTFYVEYEPTHIHPVVHKFSPPYLKISFSEEILVENKSIEKYFEEEDTDGVIRHEMNSWVGELLEGIKSGKRIHLKDIGFLFAGIQGKIQFEQDFSVNYVKDSFGLESFTSPAIQREENRLQKSYIEEKRKNPGRKVLIWITTLFIISVSTVLIVNKRDNLVSFLQEKFKIEAETPQEVIVPLGMIDTVSLIVIDDSVMVHPDDRLPIVSEKVLKYFVVAGCFKSFENAKSLVESLKAEGYNSSIQGQTSHGLYQVCYSGYETEQEAKEELSRLLRKGKTGAWLIKLD